MSKWTAFFPQESLHGFIIILQDSFFKQKSRSNDIVGKYNFKSKDTKTWRVESKKTPFHVIVMKRETVQNSACITTAISLS